MTIGTVAFNDVSSSGYRASGRGPGANKNVMEAWDAHIAPEPSKDFYVNTEYGGGATVPDPIYGERQTFTQSLIKGNTRTETLMETMFLGKSYSGPKVNTQSMKRDANKVVTDGAKVSRQANMAMSETKNQIANFQKDWKQAKTEALDKFVQSAKDMGINPSDAADEMLPDTTAGKASAVMYIAAELAIGSGSLATMGKAAFVNQELSKADKKLSPDQQKALLADTLKNLQQPNKPADTRMEASTNGVSSAIVAAIDDAPESKVAWENMETDDLAEFLAADPDGMDQPEMQELLQLEHALDEVLDNHQYVQEHYSDVVTADKMYASSSEKMTKIIMDASVVEAPRYDSLDTMLAGDSVRGVTLLASDTRFDSGGVQTYLDLTRVDVPEVKQQLSADIEQQFRAGMS